MRNSREWDVFRDPDPGVDASHHKLFSNDERTEINSRNFESVGQMASCVAELCARQQRTHCFSISIYGPTARLMRWDRSGAIVSRTFNYHENPEWLCQFLWRYSQATEIERGFDMTIRKASPEEEAAFVQVITEHVKEQARPCDGSQLSNLVGDHYENGKVYKVGLYPQQPPSPKNKRTSFNAESSTDQYGVGIASLDVSNILQKEDEVEISCKIAPSDGDILPDGSSSGSTSSWDVDKFLESVSRKKAEAAEPDILSDTDDDADDSCDIKDMKNRKQSICRRYTAIQYFLVSRPVTIPLTTTGRATRGYWAAKVPDSTTEETDYRIAFIKDTWRNIDEGTKEGEVMVELVEADVPYVSDIFCHGDVVQDDVDSDTEEDTKCEEIRSYSYRFALTIYKICQFRLH